MKKVSLFVLGLFLMGLTPIVAEETVAPAEVQISVSAEPAKVEAAKPAEVKKAEPTEKAAVPAKKTSKKTKKEAKKEKWQCKMCNISADHAGKCPHCGMKMEKI